MPGFSILACDPSSRARAGVLSTAHGDVHTPAFVPLATKATVKGLLPEEVASLGYELVLGNTFHLLLSPGPELIERLGGLGAFMGWSRPTITDSGGFQVFSMGHGTVADEIKGRARGHPGEREGTILEIDESGVRFRSYLDGRIRFLSPGGLDGDPGCAGLGYRARVRRVHALSRRPRLHRSARPSAPTGGSSAACAGARSAPGDGQLVYGIVQGGVYEDLRRESAETVAASACDGIAIGGSLGADKAQMHEVVSWATAELQDAAVARKPRHLLGIGEVDDLIAGVEQGIDTFDCAIPTRLGRHGTALVPDPHARWRLDLTKARSRESPEPLLEGCSCPACSRGVSRAYLSYLARAGELTGARLITMHNLAFLARLMADLRRGILAGELSGVARAWRAGAISCFR